MQVAVLAGACRVADQRARRGVRDREELLEVEAPLVVVARNGGTDRQHGGEPEEITSFHRSVLSGYTA
jgi:hypothetical protein